MRPCRLKLMHDVASSSSSVTVWLARLRRGEPEALDRLMPLLYRELRRVARGQLGRESAILTLSATALVHETYLRLVHQRRLDAADRQEFLRLAARVMRRVLVDHARRRGRLKRGAALLVSLPDDQVLEATESRDLDEVLAVDALLTRLHARDPRAAAIVEYRLFGGMTVDEIASLLGLSSRTVQRSWTLARAWLRLEVASADGRSDGRPA